MRGAGKKKDSRKCPSSRQERRELPRKKRKRERPLKSEEKKVNVKGGRREKKRDKIIDVFGVDAV